MKRIQSIRAGHRQSIKVRKEGLEIILYTLYSDIPSVCSYYPPPIPEHCILAPHYSITKCELAYLHHSVPIDILVKFSIVWLSIQSVTCILTQRLHCTSYMEHDSLLS